MNIQELGNFSLNEFSCPITYLKMGQRYYSSLINGIGFDHDHIYIKREKGPVHYKDYAILPIKRRKNK